MGRISAVDALFDRASDQLMPTTLTSNGSADTDTVLSVSGVSKKFCRSLKRSYLYGLKDIGGELLGLRSQSDRLRTGEFWALRDVSLSVGRGQSVGLVGLNGSGKTTLLRIISGLMKADEGEVRIRGRIAALIALGAGFNPLLTGRENVFINLSILGLTRREILSRFDAVVDFAEIWDAIDSPVRTYSSGMRARLGFACAINTNPSLLLIDEVLAVGDVQFRSKCYRKLDEIRRNGTTFLMVAHNPNMILRTCDSAIYLRKGEVLSRGDARDVMQRYDEDLRFSSDTGRTGALIVESGADDSSVKVTSVFLRDRNNEVIPFGQSAEPLRICLQCRIKSDMNQLGLGILVREVKGAGNLILNLYTDETTNPIDVISPELECQLRLPVCCLAPGKYSAKITIFSYPYSVHAIIESFEFDIKAEFPMSQCAFYQPHKWAAISAVEPDLTLNQS